MVHNATPLDYFVPHPVPVSCFSITPIPSHPVSFFSCSKSNRWQYQQNEHQEGSPLLESHHLPRPLPGAAPPPHSPRVPRLPRPRPWRPQSLGDGVASLCRRKKFSRRPYGAGRFTPARAAGAASARRAATVSRRPLRGTERKRRIAGAIRGTVARASSTGEWWWWSCRSLASHDTNAKAGERRC